MPHPSLLLARVGICWVAGSQRSLPPASRSPSRQQRRRALTVPETDSSVSHCIFRVGAELRRKRIPQNEGNHNSQRATLRRAPGCPGSRGVRDPGGPSSITRPAKPRTHPGLENRETWGTHRYLISVPKTRMALGRRPGPRIIKGRPFRSRL